MRLENGPPADDPHARRIRERMRRDPKYRAQVLRLYESKRLIRRQLATLASGSLVVLALLVLALRYLRANREPS